MSSESASKTARPHAPATRGWKDAVAVRQMRVNVPVQRCVVGTEDRSIGDLMRTLKAYIAVVWTHVEGLGLEPLGVVLFVWALQVDSQSGLRSGSQHQSEKLENHSARADP